ncbi:MAG: hypothetical protein PUF11_09565 [Parafannyhessea umbonata]|uniref:hypothetical protein n=1 Tax=Parafannyhessea umbonata TaxID=604330 RepID=UPI0026EBF56B|nr:hypothetical protein [Parafannyhessea umbonata]MDD6567013.1 hypothetical protein [Parafannyhessea umbonata]
MFWKRKQRKPRNAQELLASVSDDPAMGMSLVSLLLGVWVGGAYLGAQLAEYGDDESMEQLMSLSDDTCEVNRWMAAAANLYAAARASMEQDLSDAVDEVLAGVEAEFGRDGEQ